MRALIRRFFSTAALPVSWTILIIILLCLPGSMVPGTGIFSLEHLDKIVHIILFAVNTLFWGWYFLNHPETVQREKWILLSAATTIVLGVLLEFVQLKYIPNRSFDLSDIVADTVGAIAGGFWLFKENS